MAEKLFGGGGELGALLRSHHWSQTPLGAVETWSDDLKTAVQILLRVFQRKNDPKFHSLRQKISTNHLVK
ncbi:hypothetical protein QUB33_26230, partial [Microcoleus sp. B3-A4]